MSDGVRYAQELRRLAPVGAGEYTEYLEDTAWEVKAYCLRHRIAPIRWYRYVDIEWYLKDVRSDSRNLKKPLFDALEKGGLFANDRYIMDRTQKVVTGDRNPRAELSVVM